MKLLVCSAEFSRDLHQDVALAGHDRMGGPQIAGFKPSSVLAKWHLERVLLLVQLRVKDVTLFLFLCVSGWLFVFHG